MPGAAHPLAIGSDTWPGLAKLAEECGEAVQVIGKITAFPFLGRGELHPDGTDLVERLETEIGDLMGAMSYVVKFNSWLDQDRINKRCEQKFERFTGWDRAERERRGSKLWTP